MKQNYIFVFFNANDFFCGFFYPSQKEILKTAFRIQESAAYDHHQSETVQTLRSIAVSS